MFSSQNDNNDPIVDTLEVGDRIYRLDDIRTIANRTGDDAAIAPLIESARRDKTQASALLANAQYLPLISGQTLFELSTQHVIPITDNEAKKKVVADLLCQNKLPRNFSIQTSKKNLSLTHSLGMNEVNYYLGAKYIESYDNINYYGGANVSLDDIHDYYIEAALNGHKPSFDYLVSVTHYQNLKVMLSVAEALYLYPEWDTDTKSEAAKMVALINQQGIGLLHPTQIKKIRDRINALSLDDDNYEALCQFYLDVMYTGDYAVYCIAAKALGALDATKGLSAYLRVPPQWLTPTDIIEMTNLVMMQEWNQQAEKILASLPAEIVASLSEKVLSSDGEPLADDSEEYKNHLENKQIIFQELSVLDQADKKEQRIIPVLRMLLHAIAIPAKTVITRDESMAHETKLNVIHQFLSELTGTEAQSYTRMENIVVKICETIPYILTNKSTYDIVMGYVASPSVLFKMGMLHADTSGRKVVGLTTARLWHQASNMQNGKYAGMARLLATLTTLHAKENGSPLQHDVLYNSLRAIVMLNRFKYLDLLEDIYQLPECYIQLRHTIGSILTAEHEDIPKLNALKNELASIKIIQTEYLALEKSVATLPVHHNTIRNQVKALQSMSLTDNSLIVQYEADITAIKQSNQRLDDLKMRIDALPIQYQNIRQHIATLLATDNVNNYAYNQCEAELAAVKKIIVDIGNLQVRANLLPAKYQHIRNECDDAENLQTTTQADVQRLDNKVTALLNLAKRTAPQQAAMDVMLLSLTKLEKKLRNNNTKTKQECIQMEVVSQLHQNLRRNKEAHFSQDFSNPAAIPHAAFRDNCIKQIKSQLEDNNPELKKLVRWQTRLAYWLIHQLHRIFRHSVRINEWVKSSSAHFKVAPVQGVKIRKEIGVILR